jgi:hypothetical protein
MQITAKYFLILQTDYRLNIVDNTTINKLEGLRDRFRDTESFTMNELYLFYKEFDHALTTNSIRVRASKMVKAGILKKRGRGIYSFEKKEEYTPEITPKQKTIYKALYKKFPLLKFCIWHTSSLNEFMQHQPFRFYTMIETEKEATESVFHFLKEHLPNVFLTPDQTTLYRYISDNKESYIITPLVSESPLKKVNDVPTLSLEKMLVDLFTEPEIFTAQQGNELTIIFRTAFEKYTVNTSRLLRYADRRGKKDELTTFMKEYVNIRQ